MLEAIVIAPSDVRLTPSDRAIPPSVFSVLIADWQSALHDMATVAQAWVVMLEDDPWSAQLRADIMEFVTEAIGQISSNEHVVNAPEDMDLRATWESNEQSCTDLQQRFRMFRNIMTGSGPPPASQEATSTTAAPDPEDGDAEGNEGEHDEDALQLTPHSTDGGDTFNENEVEIIEE